MDAQTLGQLLFLQSTLDVMPDRRGIVDLVCAGLTGVPGVTSVSYLETAESEAEYTVTVSSKRQTYGAFVFDCNNAELFSRYKPHIQNVTNTVALVFDNRCYINQLNRHSESLEKRVKERTAALAHSEQTVRSVIETAGDAILGMDEAGNITLWNQAAGEMFGYNEDEAMGQNLHDLIVPERYRKDATIGMARFQQRGNGKNINKTIEQNALRRDGNEFPIELSISSMKTDRGWQALGIVRDITERKQAEEALHVSADKLAEAQRIGRMGNWEFDVTQDIGQFSDETYRIFGVTDDYRGSFKSFLHLVHPDDRRLVNQANKKAIESGSFAGIQYRIIRPNGKERIVQANGESILDTSGKPLKIFGSIQDITEHKQAEKALANLHIKTEAMADAVSDVLYMIDTNAKVIWWNRHVEKITGLSPQEIQGKPAVDFVVEEDWPKLHLAIEHVLSNGEAEADLLYNSINGPVLHHFKGSVVKDEEGTVIGITGIGRDIAAQQMAEVHVRRTSEILEMIAKGHVASGIYDAIARMYEARHPGMRCSMLTLNGNKLMHGGAPSLPKAYCDAVNGLQNGPDIGSCGTSTFTGKRVLVEDILTDPLWADLKGFAMPHGLRSCWSEPIKSAGGKILGAFGMYYNHPALPNEAELADLESAARLAGIVMGREIRDAMLNKLSQAIDHAGSSMLITNCDGIIEYVNPAFTTLTGYSAKEAIGNTPRILKSGKQDASFYKSMWHTISSGLVWQGKVVDQKKDGSLFPAMLNIAPIKDSDGSITYFVGSHADLSELEDMEAQFRQAQKMEAVGTLVGGIAHDFNNMLAGMTGNLYLARLHVEDLPDVVQKLDHIEQLARRAADMIQQLLTFARKDRVSFKRMPFTQFIKETLKFLRPSVPENIAMHQDICCESLSIEGDGTQLHQVLMNLINNARDALEDVASPCITTRLEAFHADAAWTEHHAEVSPGLYAHLSVADNGCGISEQQVEHLFEPFFTTKDVGKGTGLGLAMVFGAIKTHHGFVDVESIEGKGSTFHVYLPLPEPKEVVALSATDDGEVREGEGETILLADDEQHIIETGKEVLESLGYQVLTARNGQQAVELFKANADAIDLCLFDIVMPVMGGDQASHKIRQMNPEMKIIFATGYDKNTQDHLEGEAVLSKPFSVVEMSQVIRQQLDN